SRGASPSAAPAAASSSPIIRSLPHSLLILLIALPCLWLNFAETRRPRIRGRKNVRRKRRSQPDGIATADVRPAGPDADRPPRSRGAAFLGRHPGKAARADPLGGGEGGPDARGREAGAGNLGRVTSRGTTHMQMLLAAAVRSDHICLTRHKNRVYPAHGR